MIKRFTIGNIRTTFTIARIAKVAGVNSYVKDNKHILMWDFDDVPLPVVVTSLGTVQINYNLPDIQILETKKDTNFIAYCFYALDWKTVVRIIADTRQVDWNFFKFGVYRGRFTLRVTAKKGIIPKKVMTLYGNKSANCSPNDLHSWVIYETLDRR